MAQVTLSSRDHFILPCLLPLNLHHTLTLPQPSFLKIFLDSLLLSASITGPWRESGDEWLMAWQGADPKLVCRGCQFLSRHAGHGWKWEEPWKQDPETGAGGESWRSRKWFAHVKCLLTIHGRVRMHTHRGHPHSKGVGLAAQLRIQCLEILFLLLFRILITFTEFSNDFYWGRPTLSALFQVSRDTFPQRPFTS